MLLSVTFSSKVINEDNTLKRKEKKKGSNNVSSYEAMLHLRRFYFFMTPVRRGLCVKTCKRIKKEICVKALLNFSQIAELANHEPKYTNRELLAGAD